MKNIRNKENIKEMDFFSEGQLFIFNARCYVNISKLIQNEGFYEFVRLDFPNKPHVVFHITENFFSQNPEGNEANFFSFTL